ncbi:MAG: hypothetical protein GYB67_11830, partial [Chloroflexi bacterium]|nr:hypothetical protein [Chloroflexota bacterium]
MYGVETIVIDFLLNFFDREAINAFLRDPQTTATIVGALIAVAGALLGSFLLLRGLALTSDAISHTVLLGIVVAFMIVTALLGREPDTSSPWLIIGAAAAGVATVILTELIHRSGLVRQDAALGLAFPLLFAIAIILISRFVDDVHLDEDAVMVGEIGIAWANTNSHCIENCQTVTITPEDERATITRQCINCRDLGISPRDDGAAFREICTNCGTYAPGQAWQAGLLTDEPALVFWPRSITVTAVLALLTMGFVTLFYKELKLTSFDAALAQALGFRPSMMHYALMVLVSLVAVGAFDAVGSILVIAFFIIPPAAAYLLTDRISALVILGAVIAAVGAHAGWPPGIIVALIALVLVALFYSDLRLTSIDATLAEAVGLRRPFVPFTLVILVGLAAIATAIVSRSPLLTALFIIPLATALILRGRLSIMLVLSAIIGSAGAVFGYDLARGDFLGILQVSDVIAFLNRAFGLSLIEQWDSSISASMVLMMFCLFLLAWMLSPNYGLISTIARRADQRRRFNDQVVLAHIYNHQYTAVETDELNADRLYEHFRWSRGKMGRVLVRLRAANQIEIVDNIVRLTPRG